jgi:hypothetical protein
MVILIEIEMNRKIYILLAKYLFYDVNIFIFQLSFLFFYFFKSLLYLLFKKFSSFSVILEAKIFLL